MVSSWIVRVVIGMVLVVVALCGVHGETVLDLYAVLGVSKTATKSEIKRAYRRKALDTHPDKTRHQKNKEVAAEEFRQVVHAFEVLSDDTSRSRYDRTGRAGQATGNNNNNHHQQQQPQGYGGWSWSFQWNTGGGGSSSSNSGGRHHHNTNNYYYQRYQRVRLKDRFEVKEAQSRLLHIVSLEQLETVIVDEDGRLERNLVICFCPAPLEGYVMDEMVYPYPFAGMSSQGIWWEDLLQTTMVRFHRSNDLTRAFGIPNGDDLNEPVFVFGRRGEPLRPDNDDHHDRIQTRDRTELEAWMWRMLEVNIEFVNDHDHPVEGKVTSCWWTVPCVFPSTIRRVVISSQSRLISSPVVSFPYPQCIGSTGPGGGSR
jgi:curved DNA-binding protein CbpA